MARNVVIALRKMHNAPVSFATPLALAAVSLLVACTAAVGSTDEKKRGAQAEGDWCPDDGLYCGGDVVSGDSSVLYRCSAHVLSVEQSCSAGCITHPAPIDDECAAPPPPPPPANECPNDGLYCGGDHVAGDAGTLYRCTSHRLSVERACDAGCTVEPAGVDDHCASPPPPPPSGGDWGANAVARAAEWVSAGMPYCGGPNGGADLLCGGTCWRGGASSNPDWDRYRSDCSGLLSWAWGLPAPGRTTWGFAPYDSSVSYLVAGADLQPGDALNDTDHVVLFAGWVDASRGKARIIEEYNCGHVATDHVLTLSVDGSPSVYVSDWSPHSYSAIRFAR